MKERKRHKYIREITLLTITLALLLTSSYAWLTLKLSGEKTNILRAGKLSLVLDDTTSDGILLEKAVPMSDEKGKTTQEYTFTLKNEGSTALNYTIYLDDVDLEDTEVRMQDSYIKYRLVKNETETVALLTSLTNRALDTGVIEATKTNTYKLQVWIDSAADNAVMDTIFNAKLRVTAEQGNKASETPVVTTLCKRATTLHTETCSQTSDYCAGDGYASGDTITYGSLGTSGTLSTGDAFDCDVNGDGTYDEIAERFYYVSDMTNGVTTDSNTAVLIYYNNVSGGVPSNSTSYAYDSSDKNNNGPVTAIGQLPTTTQWSNVSLTSTTRAITNELGGTTTDAGDLPTAFSYDGYAARLLTAQEVSSGCGFTVGSSPAGELISKCKFLMENTKYSSSTLRTYGPWFETPYSSNSNSAWCVFGHYRNVITSTVYNASSYGVRPAIEVLKSNISY